MFYATYMQTNHLRFAAYNHKVVEQIEVYLHKFKRRGLLNVIKRMSYVRPMLVDIIKELIE